VHKYFGVADDVADEMPLPIVQGITEFDPRFTPKKYDALA